MLSGQQRLTEHGRQAHDQARPVARIGNAAMWRLRAPSSERRGPYCCCAPDANTEDEYVASLNCRSCRCTDKLIGHASV
ncbi:g4882 [Coccomyxa elongata]